MFGILVSLWALADLAVTLWVSRKLGMDNLLNDDVRTVAAKIAGYRKFYAGMLMVSMIPFVVMFIYMFTYLYDPGLMTLLPYSSSQCQALFL